MKTDIERKKADLQRELELLERKEKHEKEKEESLKLLVGRYFKSEETWGRSTAKTTSYIYVASISEKDYWRGYVDVDRFEVSIDRSNWSIIDGNIVFKNPRAKMSASVRNRSYDLGRAVNGIDKMQPEGAWKNDDGTVTLRYTSSTFYHECSKKEYDSVLSALNKSCEIFISTFDKEMNNPTSIDRLTIVELKAISDLVATLDRGITLTELTAVAKKVAKFNYFDKNNQLPELVQYTRTGEKGLNLNILGGDDGTDYEPYTTRYYIDCINVDWATILYPIRTQINGKVMDLVSKLEKLKEVYYTSSWKCEYDTSGYDASFEKAYLRPNILAKVNTLIKENLK